MKKFPRYFARKGIEPVIGQKPSAELGICVVIPVFKEKQLGRALDALVQCEKPTCKVELILVVNHPEDSPQDIVSLSQQAVETAQYYQQNYGTERFAIYPIKAYDLPRKHAGVGLARQIGMDEAALRLHSVGKPNGIIACFDADSECKPNYLTELERLWITHPETDACSIRYEHPLKGSEYPPEVYEAIARYELHLRYYNQASRYIGFPFAYHTVGSSMACSAEAYTRFGGMNRRQAGEDFYFLQKIIPHGRFRELNTTIVYPSPRPSDRVPFGTGRAISGYLAGIDPIATYQLDSFLSVIPFFKSLDKLFPIDRPDELDELLSGFPVPLKQFLSQRAVLDSIRSIRRNTSGFTSFKKRFFLWFDGFALLKYLNYSHQTYYTRKPVEAESVKLLKKIGVNGTPEGDTISLLQQYRKLDLEEYRITL